MMSNKIRSSPTCLPSQENGTTQDKNSLSLVKYRSMKNDYMKSWDNEKDSLLLEKDASA